MAVASRVTLNDLLLVPAISGPLALGGLHDKSHYRGVILHAAADDGVLTAVRETGRGGEPDVSRHGEL